MSSTVKVSRAHLREDIREAQAEMRRLEHGIQRDRAALGAPGGWRIPSMAERAVRLAKGKVERPGATVTISKKKGRFVVTRAPEAGWYKQTFKTLAEADHAALELKRDAARKRSARLGPYRAGVGYGAAGGLEYKVKHRKGARGRRAFAACRIGKNGRVTKKCGHGQTAQQAIAVLFSKSKRRK